MPEALLHKVIKEDRDKYLDMYHRIEEGETLVSADLWIKWYADAIPVRRTCGVFGFKKIFRENLKLPMA